MTEPPRETQKQKALDDAEPEILDWAIKPKVNGHDNPKHSGHQRKVTDPEAHEMVISSLRAQVQDLFGQVTELNNKLVKSYDRVSDLEDDLHVASANLRSSSLRISQLELERTQHLSALNTGLLVEKDHVTAELNRLMERATEEAAQRGQAESARADIEKDLDDLSASLFAQANTMVAEARYAQHLSEEKVGDAQRALKGAEEAVAVMQQQMQALQAVKDETDKRMKDMEVVMGKGKWGARDAGDVHRPLCLLSTHLPYQEFLLFVAHLRTIHPSTPHPPAMTALLQLPFLARLNLEDSEPTVRLDLAPSLNWLTRRSVLSAIHNGQLTVEPISSSVLLHGSSPHTISGYNSSTNSVSCALCGTSILSPSDTQASTSNASSSSVSWSTALFKRNSQPQPGSSGSRPPSPPRLARQASRDGVPPQIHIFRIASSSSSTSSTPVPMSRANSTAPSSSSSSAQMDVYYAPYHPHSHTHPPTHSHSNSQSSTIYPLCTSNWCLARLRTTCSLWAFVRTGIIEKVWDEEIPMFLPPPTITAPAPAEKPPVPPRRRGLWGMASALGGKAASWGESDKEKAKKTAAAAVAQQQQQAPLPPPPASEPRQARLPPPPTHPSVAAAHATNAPVPSSAHPVPPPLPKRSDVRRQPSPSVPPPSQQSQPVVINLNNDSESTGAENVALPETLFSANLSPPPPPPRPPRRPLTPANVPLPESRPGTPLLGEQLTAAPSLAAPIATQSRAPVSPTPPPLPRRAVARAPRPSRAEGSGSHSRPGTPVSPPPAFAADASGMVSPPGERTSDVLPAYEEGLKVKEEPKAEEAAMEGGEKEKGKEAVGEKSVEGQDGEKGEPALEESAKKGKSAEELSTEAERPTSPVDEKRETAPEHAPTTEAGALTTDIPQSSENGRTKVDPATGPSHDAGVDEDKDKDRTDTVAAEKPDEASPRTNEAQAEVMQDTVSRVAIEIDSKKEDCENNGEIYVGEATWEERTWKELVKLREQMFWARVGGVKQA